MVSFSALQGGVKMSLLVLTTNRLGHCYEGFLGTLNSNFEEMEEIDCTDAKIHFVLMVGEHNHLIVDRVINSDEKQTLSGVYDRVTTELESCREPVGKISATTYKFALSLFLKNAWNQIIWIEKKKQIARIVPPQSLRNLCLSPTLEIAMKQPKRKPTRKSFRYLMPKEISLIPTGFCLCRPNENSTALPISSEFEIK